MNWWNSVSGPHLVVIPKQLVQKIQRLRGDQVLVLGTHELGPRLAAVAPDQRLQLRVQLDAVLAQVRVQLVGPQDLRVCRSDPGSASQAPFIHDSPRPGQRLPRTSSRSA